MTRNSGTLGQPQDSEILKKNQFVAKIKIVLVQCILNIGKGKDVASRKIFYE